MSPKLNEILYFDSFYYFYIRDVVWLNIFNKQIITLHIFLKILTRETLCMIRKKKGNYLEFFDRISKEYCNSQE